MLCQCVAIKQAPREQLVQQADAYQIEQSPPAWLTEEALVHDSKAVKIDIRQIEIVRRQPVGRRAAIKPIAKEMNPAQVEQFLSEMEDQRAEVKRLGMVSGADGGVFGMSQFDQYRPGLDMARMLPTLSVKVRPVISPTDQTIALNVFAVVRERESEDVLTRIDTQVQVTSGNSYVLAGVPRGVGVVETKRTLLRPKRERLTKQIILVIKATEFDPTKTLAED